MQYFNIVAAKKSINLDTQNKDFPKAESLEFQKSKIKNFYYQKSGINRCR